jgi:hypothetical protein
MMLLAAIQNAPSGNEDVLEIMRGITPELNCYTLSTNLCKSLAISIERWQSDIEVPT